MLYKPGVPGPQGQFVEYALIIILVAVIAIVILIITGQKIGNIFNIIVDKVG